ncbi:hypothetical protein ACJRO7_026885 [Eucalyptus globulus]|uniref:AAA+ ATPase domain-containing protein n=1 Tax=Eucalyptus globulus TaxID=34317 RepID=A0ABD3JRZ8_EUCGL
MSADSVVSIVWDVLKMVVVPIKRQFGYAISSKSYAQNLQKEVGKLENKAKRLHNASEVARNNLRNFYREFTEWEASTEEALKEAGILLDDFEKATKTCCYGTLPDPYWRYQFSRKAKGKIEVIKQLTQKCSEFKELNDICFTEPAPGNVTALTPARIEDKDVVQSNISTATISSASMSNKLRDDDIFESRAQIIRDIKEALADNSNSVVGVHGMGGLGKSTLLEEVKRIISKEKWFDWVAKADVSKNPDIKMIQGEIADALGLSEIKDKESVSGRAELLQRRLRKEENDKKKVLIILDNLWEGLDLNKVGIPCGHDNKVLGCKLLLTSRDRDVLRRNMGCDKDFLLGGLKEEEAKRLFEGTVGAKVHDDEFKPLVNVALDKCAGVPFLIVAMAKRFKDANLSEWKDTLKKVEKFKDKEINDSIHQMLQWSYEKLEEEVKSLLQLCVVYGTSNPSLENLVRYSVGLGLFQEVSSMEEARNRLSSHIRTLQASSLLLDSEDVDGFKIHDLVHDFIVAVSLRDHPLLVLKDEVKSVIELLNDKPRNYMAICFPYVDMEELPQKLDCPELRVFLLFTNNESLHVPDSLFNYTRKLMVLNLTGVHLTHSPLPFQLLENLHTLCLDGCSLEDVAILGKLKGLQILSFENSNIQRLPKEIGQLVELRLLDLNYCSELQIIEPGVLGSLIKLEELCMMYSFDQWNAWELPTPPTNASLVELNNMKKLCTLYVSIPDPSVLPKDLNVDKLTKYEIQIGKGNTWHLSIGEGLRILELNLTSDILQKECIQSILGKTDDLFLDGHDGIEQSVCALSEKGFPTLKHLQVKDSPSIHYIHQSSSHTNFKRLESLILIDLINVETLCHNHIYYKSFSALKTVQVKSCHKMEVLFPLSSLRELPWLEEIEVSNCKSMQGIVEADDCGNVELHNLHVLKLYDLPNIKNFFNTRSTPLSSMPNDQVGMQNAFFSGQQVAFPNLETLYITSLNNIEMIWDNQVVAESFTKLKSLCVYGCNKLVNIVHSFILRWLLSLERLNVKACGSLEVVFEFWPLKHLDGHPIALPLKELTTSALSKLKRVWDKELHCQAKFQCLHSISVSECESLTSLFPTSIAKDLMQLEELEINKCGIVEIIENEEGPVPKFVFPMLTSLELKFLRELKCLYTGLHTSHWPALKSLKVHGCDKVEILASHLENEMPLDKQPLFLIEKGTFPNLQELKLDLSERMEIWHGHCHDGEFFCKLSLLQLRHLSRESSISTCRFVESLTNLEELVVCESYLEDPSSNEEAIEGTGHEMKVILPFSRYIRHLQTLDVSYCDGLSKMFTPTIAENLVALTKLRISNCRILTEVINDEKGGDGCVVAFNQLKYMELDGLIWLRSFSSGGYTLMFPLLEDIIVTRCPNMKFFSLGPTEASKLKRVQVSKEAWFWAGNLNITIQNMFEEMGTLAGVGKIQLSEFPELIGKWHNELNPIKSFWQLKLMVVDKCPSFINAIPSRLMLVLDNLSHLQVRDCELLEEIFDLEGLEVVESTRVLPRLWELNLVNLPKLRRLWNIDLQESLCFNSLERLILYNCSDLGHAFSPSMAQCLANLEVMEIKECGQMEGVIVDEEAKGSAMEKITFPELWQMKLECLPNLTCLLLGKNHTLECPKLIVLSITYCPKMRSLTRQSWMENVHNNPSLFTPQVQFPKLRSMDLSHMDNLSKIWIDTPQETLTFDCLWKVEVRNCKSLETLFPYWVATSLTELQKIQVESCEIDEIVASGDDTPCSNTTQDHFPKLTSLVLHDMPRLKSFCPKLPSLNWPLLKELRVTHCDKLNMLSFAASMNSWAQRDNQQDLLDQEAHSSFERDFPNLERLLLVNNNIQMIQDGNFSDDMFSKLKALTLACFHDKKAVFPSIFLLERFQNLQSLEVFCSSFEDLFPNEGLVEERKHSALENLRELKLNKLHNLKCVWREDSLVSKILQSIKTFQVWDCPCLTTIFPTETSFQNLTNLLVKNCSGLVHLVTTSAVTNLVHLTYMTIIGCERMKEVMADDGNREGKVISFEKLSSLTLEHLPNLECFSSIPSCIFRFPSLRKIEVEECPKMKNFSKGTLSTPKLTYVSLFRYEWKGNWEKGDFNITIQKLAA